MTRGRLIKKIKFKQILFCLFFLFILLKLSSCSKEDGVNTSAIDSVLIRKKADSLKKITLDSFKNLQSLFTARQIKWCVVPVPNSVFMQSQTHPSIVYTKKKWNGYSLWLGTTPYPRGKDKFENPCIYYSDVEPDGNYKFTPILNNPILDNPNFEHAFNSDVELILLHDTLFSLVRECLGRKYFRDIKVQNSTDGQTWSKPIHVYSEADTKDRDLISPAIIQHNGKLYIYHLNGNSGNSPTGKCTSLEILEGTSLTNPDFKFYGFGNFVNKSDVHIEPWHMDLFEHNNILYMLFCGRDLMRPATLITYIAYSTDYVNFTIVPKPLIDCINTYRPTGYVEAGFLNLFCSGVGYYAPDGSDRAIGYCKIKMEYLKSFIDGSPLKVVGQKSIFENVVRPSKFDYGLHADE